MKDSANFSTLKSLDKPSTLLSTTSRFRSTRADFTSPTECTSRHTIWMQAAKSLKPGSQRQSLASSSRRDLKSRYTTMEVSRGFSTEIPSFLGEKQTLANEKEEGELRLDVPELEWCAFCGCETTTEVKFKSSSKTLWSSIGIFLMGGILGCFMLPYMSSSCKEAYLRCIRCKHLMSLKL